MRNKLPLSQSGLDFNKKRYTEDNVKNCTYCNGKYIARRSTSRYCSGNCRIKAWKAGKQQEPEKSYSPDNEDDAVYGAETVPSRYINFFADFYSTLFLILGNRYDKHFIEQEMFYFNKLENKETTMRELIDELLKQLP